MTLKTQDLPDLRAAPTISDIILNFLRRAIIDGTLDAGAPIRQDDIARQFNVSKIPVREALKKLEAEGLVKFQRNKGAVVTSLSEPEIVQIFEVRAVLEASALSFSLPLMSQETLNKAENYCDLFAQEADVSLWSALNWKFHSCLYEDAKRPYLVNMIRSVNDQLERYLRIQLTLSHGKEQADMEHRALLDLCKKGDVDGAAQYLSKHIMSACNSLIHHLSANGK